MSRIAGVLSIGSCLLLCSSVQSESAADINAKVAQLHIDTARLDDVLRIFGEPEQYFWNGKKLSRDNLPRVYMAVYPDDLSVVIANGEVHELRFESARSGYAFENKLRVGSSLDDVLKVLGKPEKTVVGKPNAFRENVLYKDIGGKKGHCYYHRQDHSVRMFFLDYNIVSLYLTKDRYRGSDSFQKVRPIRSVRLHDDVRWKDMSKLDFSTQVGLIETLRFNEKTVWPSRSRMEKDADPRGLMIKAMNPGLGVRNLHRQGITGKGVNVAIIDQPLYKDHPEFAGKIVAYHDVGCGMESSMHGPAVASLLVGANCGTAPDARLYYVAAPSWTKDTAYQAKALDWIVEQNSRLSGTEKIRVVSVSAAPSGVGSPFEKNQHLWDLACRRAEAQGILVLDCTSHRGFIGRCWLDRRRREDVAKCSPASRSTVGAYHMRNHVLAPTCPRTVAEQHDPGKFSYTYCGTGGLSWAIPYCAGVLAMGWQVRPDLGPQQMRDLLFESAYKTRGGNKIINPEKFIELVKKAPRSSGY